MSSPNELLKISNPALGIVAGLLVVILFSSFTIISKMGLHTSMDLTDIAALRFGIAGIVMLPIFAHRGFRGIRFVDAIALCFFGGVGFALCAYTGFQFAPAAHGAVLLHGTLSLTTAVLAGIFIPSTITKYKAIGLIAILIGIVVMLVDSISVSTISQLSGDFALLLASFFWSAYGLLVRRIGLAPIHSASIVAVFSMCIYLPVYFYFSNSIHIPSSWNNLLLQSIFQGLLIGCASVYIYAISVANLGVHETALLTASIPLVTTFAGWYFLNETPSTASIFGISIVTSGMLFSFIGDRRKASQS